MFGRITEERADLWFPIRMIPRSLSLCEDSDFDIDEWSGNHPEAPRPSDLGMGRIPELLATRISQHRRIGLNLTTPFDSTNRIRSPGSFSGANGFSYDGIDSHPDNA